MDFPTLSYEITLHIPIIIFAGPYITPITFKSIRNHVIYKTVFIPNNQECQLSINAYERKVSD